ncbi:glutathione S-transferase family protein [Myxococcus landrumensis]|uniref:Glutathione S-transferase family protein n=1 Tax=Myxococcus landrumensis TaxID=2813577 RepID=A0ABX7MXV6_9BACT|nr:glutathione S-transferase family protein [Myxococcus landrumus]QSQ11121.1 glutathione S-transferase family protein [Myxococcus landrumus]
MTQLTLVVGSKNYSSWSLRPYMALAQTGQPFQEEVIQLDRPDTAERIARVSPSGRVPLLKHGDLLIWDSLAICEYLADTFPEARLWPESREARAVARAVTAEMHSGFEALREHMGMNLRARKPGQGRTPSAMEAVRRVQQIWNDCRARFGKGGPYLFGHFTIADAFYTPVATRFVTYEVSLDPVCDAYRDALVSHPGFLKWAEAARHEPPVQKYE